MSQAYKLPPFMINLILFVFKNILIRLLICGKSRAKFHFNRHKREEPRIASVISGNGKLNMKIIMVYTINCYMHEDF